MFTYSCAFAELEDKKCLVAKQWQRSGKTVVCATILTAVINVIIIIIIVHSQKKVTKAVTEAVLFQKVPLSKNVSLKTHI